MSKNVTKNLLAKYLHYETGLPLTMLEKFLDSLFEQIIQSTVRDGITKIPKFGSFNIKHKKPKIGRNLNTLEAVVIPARKVISFQSSEYLRQVINNEVK